MIQMNRRHLIIASSALLLPNIALAEEKHEVLMLNRHPEDKKKKMVFHPVLTVVEPGDTVTFVPEDKSHNSESMKGGVPKGAEGWKGKTNKEVEVTFEVPGFYGYQCRPHVSMGMIGLVVVKGDGMMDNYEDVKNIKLRGKRSKAVWEEVFAMVDEEGLTA